MNNSRLNKKLRNIEHQGNNDFVLLEECGAEYFATNDLLELYGRVKERMRIYVDLSKINILIVASSLVWTMSSIFLILSGWKTLAMLSLFMLPLTLLISAGLYFFHKKGIYWTNVPSTCRAIN